MKRIVKTFSVFFAAIMMLSSGCTSEHGKNAEETEKINITFSFWEPGIYNELENGLQIVADEYEALHPEVDIELIAQPVSTYSDWIKERLVANDLPDIQSNFAIELTKQYKAGMIVDISDYLNSESSYAKGCLWKETFIPKCFEQANEFYAGDGCNIPIFGTETGIFYNKKIYEELNLEIPNTWDEFINNCEIIKQSGKTPIALMARKIDALAWLNWKLATGLFLDKFLYDKNININEDMRISGGELSYAVLNGALDYRSEEVREIYGIFIKHLEEYFKYCDDALELEESVAKAMFLSGEAAHINTGSWDVSSLVKNPSKDFEVGVFRFPQFTKENSPYAGVSMSSNSVQTIAVTKSAYSSEGKLDVIMDFLQFFTSKEIYQRFVSEAVQIPVVNDVTIDGDLKGFVFDGSYQFEIFSLSEDFDMMKKMLSGTEFELNHEFFEKRQQDAEETAKQKKLGDIGYIPEKKMGKLYN